MTNKAEQETIIRWDQEGPEAELYTAHPARARHWEKQGYAVEVCDQGPEGETSGVALQGAEGGGSIPSRERWRGGEAETGSWASVLCQNWRIGGPTSGGGDLSIGGRGVGGRRRHQSRVSESQRTPKQRPSSNGAA